MTTHVLPLDFRLHDANDEAVLALGEARELKLELRNTSPTALYFNPLVKEHHFTLRFRAGVLQDHGSIGINEADLAHWDVDLKEEQGDVLVMLRRKTEATWASGHKLKLILEGLRGEYAGGTRATRVELAFEHIRSEDKDGALLAGKPRHHQMVLTMPSAHQAQPRPLLQAHFVGETGNVVLNDGKAHHYALRLRLTNTTPHWLLFTRTTELRVTLAGGPVDAPGALASGDELARYELKASIASLPSDPGSIKGQLDAMKRGWIPRGDAAVPATLLLECRASKDEPMWTLHLPENAAGPFEIRPDAHLDIEIGKIVSRNANGPSDVRVQWLNVSHPDRAMRGEVVATIQKSPLVIVGRKVGIGRIPSSFGPDLDVEAIQEALDSAKRAMAAVVSSSMRGKVTFRYWQFNDGFHSFRWPTLSWKALDVYWPPAHSRISIPRRELTQAEWQEAYAWLKTYPNPGFPRYPNDVPYFFRSPHELFYLFDPAEARYLNGPADSEHQRIQGQYAQRKALRRAEMGLPLKPHCSLYLKADSGPSTPGQRCIHFADRTMPEETKTEDWVFIARWDESGVTVACDVDVDPAELRAVRLPPLP